MRVQQTVIVGKPLDAMFGYLMSFHRVEGGTEVTYAAAPPPGDAAAVGPGYPMGTQAWPRACSTSARRSAGPSAAI